MNGLSDCFIAGPREVNDKMIMTLDYNKFNNFTSVSHELIGRGHRLNCFHLMNCYSLAKHQAHQAVAFLSESRFTG